jgi:predicted Zn-dependent protease
MSLRFLVIIDHIILIYARKANTKQQNLRAKLVPSIIAFHYEDIMNLFFTPSTDRIQLSALILVSMLIMTGCSTNKATGSHTFTAFMTEKEERKVGAEEHLKIMKEFGGPLKGLRLRAYVKSIGEALAQVSEVPNLPYKFTILNDEKVNAFALPGGYVYITRGLLALAESEAEIAGVLAHEIGHITARHSAQRYSASKATNIGLTIFSVLSSAAGIPRGLGQAVSYGTQAAVQGYSRQQELEADMLGVRYMTRLGYSPDAMSTFFQKMGAHADLEAKEKGKEGIGHNIMSTHPRTSDRIKQAIILAKTKPVANPLIKRTTYLSRVNGLIFGDDPAQGIRKGRFFTHPELRIQFKVPPGFVLFNSPKHVTAIGPNKSEIKFDQVNPELIRQSGTLSKYLLRYRDRNLNLQNVEGIDVNGMKAATGLGRLKTNQGPRDVRLLVIKGEDENVFRLTFITTPKETQKLSEEFRRTTYSFHRLSPTEAQDVRPLKIRLIKVRKGDTVKTLAYKHMPFEKYKREWFQVLNGLNDGARLTVGQQVKIVSE